jgi:molybdopterin/thiamine biosynthesis adenylyltransferase/rhodanese-related sulfurtransferase
LLLDVREDHEHEALRIPGALHVPLGSLASRIPALAPDRSRPIIAFCASGVRSLKAARALIDDLGYADVRSMAGGISRWREEGLSVEEAPGLTPQERERYARHLVMPEVGAVGQERLLAARVLIVGAGGLGAPVALYLAAAGVGTIGLVDDDVVDVSNLQRQVIHSTEGVGTLKVDSARERLGALNPGVDVIAHPVRLTAGNVLGILEGWDVIVDGADNFPTRYLLNDASVRLGIPVVSAAISGFEGQLSVFVPREGPCYRCVFPEPPPAELAPSCAEGGVLGVLPGTMGLLQATEALKLVLGLGRPAVGRLLLYDALEATLGEVRVGRDPSCPVCSRDPEDIPEDELGVFPDYEAFCSIPVRSP